MTYWKPGRVTNWGRKCTSSFRAEYRQYIIEVGICEGDIMYVVHYWDGSQTVHTTPAMLIPDHVVGADNIQIFKYTRDQYLQIQFMANDQTRWYWMNAEDLKEIKDLEKKLLPILRIEGEHIFFHGGGTQEIIPIGKSWRGVLNRDENFDWHNWHPTVRNLADYQKVIMNSGQNYERIDIKNRNEIADIELTREHVREVYKKAIIVEITLDDGKTFRIKNWKEAVDELGKEPNVILQVNNEFADDWDALRKAKEKVDYIVDKGFIASGGAWGYSENGEKIAEEYLKVNAGQICSVHRGPYPPLASWQIYIQTVKKSGKVVLCDELLVHDPNREHGWQHPGAPWEELEQYVIGALSAGANGVNVYTGIPNYSYFGLMGEICQRVNS